MIISPGELFAAADLELTTCQPLSRLLTPGLRFLSRL